MQKLSKRNTYTPTDTPHVRSNCGQSLNNPLGVMDSVAGLKTLDNNLEVDLTPRERGGRNQRESVVYVLNRWGSPLMPTKPQKAGRLLNEGRAKVVKTNPFTIQILYTTSRPVEKVTAGVDLGYKHVGVSVVSEDKELLSMEAELRTGEPKLNSERASNRSNRRGKLWYRKPRFLNRKKPKGWIAPSLRHKKEATIRLINNVCKILPVTDIVVEEAKFDIQKLKNPDISGEEYQQGDQYGFANVKEYVFHRDGHKCRHCKGKSKDKRLRTHHIISRQTGGDRPDNLLTVCVTCHDKHHAGEITIKAKPKRGYKAEIFMNIVRKQFVEELRTTTGLPVTTTFGYITRTNREALSLPKSHTNDAFVIAGGNGQVRNNDTYYGKFVRKNNRKLRKMDGRANIAKKEINGWQRFDKVRYNGIDCFIWGRMSTGYVTLKTLDGTLMGQGIKMDKIQLLEKASTLLLERRGNA